MKRSYERNAPELIAYLRNQYPNFVLDTHPKKLENEIPVFTFHSVEPLRLEKQLQFLKINKYRTLTADEFYQIITDKKRFPEKAVLLTFDDGLGSLWSIAYPLLK
ncbi:MAG: polysaccharide deacetylase, partial [Candidatus Hodarchaeota archaeon]